MTMAEALDQAGQELRGTDGNEIKSSKLKKRAAELSGRKEGSIQPSDFCHNRINDGINLSEDGARLPPYDRPVFLRVRRGFYKYVGPDYKYDGEVVHEPRR